MGTLARILGGAWAFVVLLALMPGSAGASLVFNVNSTKDGIDADIGDGTCATAQGKCTLRAAIDQANASPVNDEIDLPKGTLKLTQPAANGGTGDNSTGDLDVSEPVEINGRGPDKTVIEQTVGDGVLRNAAPFAGFSAPGLVLHGVTLTGGHVGGAGESGGGGLRNDEFALLDHVVIRDNVAVSDVNDDVPGGGIVSYGSLGLSHTMVRDNRARGRGAAGPVGGGILIGDGSLSVQKGSRIVRNSARLRDGTAGRFASGGGLVLENPGAEPADSVLIVDSTIADNSAVGGKKARAGGISAGAGTFVDLTGSTVSGNRSRLAGGLYATSSTAHITNSTFSGNSDTKGGGAAIWQEGDPDMVQLNHVTVAQNRPSKGHFAIESGELAQAGSLSLRASIVANPRKECGGEAGAIEAEAHNVIADSSCSDPPVTDDEIANPKLKPLSDNGGPTKTHALKASSPAIGLDPICPFGVDQRGKPRAFNSACDSGAFERPG
jgi:hypothetical protein